MEQKKQRLTRAKLRGKENSARLALKWCAAVLACFFAAYLIFGVLLTGVAVNADDMSPTVNEGDVVLIDNISKYLFGLKRGQVVAFKTPDGAALGRIVALEGETVLMQEGELFINSARLDESGYIATKKEGNISEFKLKQNTFLVMTDDRESPQAIELEFYEISGILRLRVSPVSQFCIFD